MKKSPAPSTPSVPQAFAPQMEKRSKLLVLLGFIVVGVLGCAGASDTAATGDSGENSGSAAENSESTESDSDDSDDSDDSEEQEEEAEQSDSGDLGPVFSASLPFAQTHTREPGVGGEGWTVSIDQVVSIPSLLDDGTQCLAIVGTATLDSLDEGLTSSGFSFPEIILIQNGVENASIGICNTDDLAAQGAVQSAGAEVTEGTTFQWFKSYRVQDQAFDFVAVEETIYEETGAEVQVGERREPTSAGSDEDGPFAFGEAHSRDAGFGGEGWTVAVDDVVSVPPLVDDGTQCLAVVGTATLDSLDDGFVSSGFSFPEIVLIQNGVENSSIGICDTDELGAQGVVQSAGAQVTEGTTFQWFKTYSVTEEAYELVAIGETIYQQ